MGKLMLSIRCRRVLPQPTADGDQDLLVIEDYEATVVEYGLDHAALISAPHAYIDRHGDYRAPFPVAVTLALESCRKYPLDILRMVQAEEDAYRTAMVTGHYVGPRWVSDGYKNTLSHFEKELQEEAPVYALVREWCGGEARSDFDRISALESEVQRLRTLVSSEVDWLKSMGHHVRAATVLRELNPSTRAENGKRRARRGDKA